MPQRVPMTHRRLNRLRSIIRRLEKLSSVTDDMLIRDRLAYAQDYLYELQCDLSARPGKPHRREHDQNTVDCQGTKAKGLG